MKRIICIICLLVLSGCGNSYLYQPDKTLEQSLQDSLMCKCPPAEIFSGPCFYSVCMERLGYQLFFNKKRLPVEFRTHKYTDRSGWTYIIVGK